MCIDPTIGQTNTQADYPTCYWRHLCQESSESSIRPFPISSCFIITAMTLPNCVSFRSLIFPYCLKCTSDILLLIMLTKIGHWKSHATIINPLSNYLRFFPTNFGIGRSQRQNQSRNSEVNCYVWFQSPELISKNLCIRCETMRSTSSRTVKGWRTDG